LAEGGAGVAALILACERAGIRIEEADRALARIARKENCFAAMVFRKREGTLDAGQSHVVLHNPADAGNAGSILRTCLGLGIGHLAVIRPAVDLYDPHVVRASMGALFRLEVAHFDDFAAYRAAFPAHALYPFMLTGARPLHERIREARAPYALVFGNEATGLPEVFAGIGHAVRIPQGALVDSLNVAAAAAIGIYAFQQAVGALERLGEQGMACE
jgi:TrmH family RNA methyltransferase